MDVEIVVHGDHAGDELRNLRGWLLDEPELRGRARLRERPAEPGTLPGGNLEAVLVAVGGGTAAVALVRTLGNVLVTWLKTRRGQVDITVTGSNGAKVALTTKDLPGLSADDVRDVLDELVRTLASPQDQPGSTDDRSASPSAADAAGVPGAAGPRGAAGATGSPQAHAGRRPDPAS